MTAEQILVVILSSALAVFLVLAIVLTVQLIKIASKIRQIADRAEQTVEHVEGFVANVQQAVAPAAFGTMVVDFIGKIVGKKKDKRR